MYSFLLHGGGALRSGDGLVWALWSYLALESLTLTWFSFQIKPSFGLPTQTTTLILDNPSLWLTPGILLCFYSKHYCDAWLVTTCCLSIGPFYWEGLEHNWAEPWEYGTDNMEHVPHNKDSESKYLTFSILYFAGKCWWWWWKFLPSKQKNQLSQHPLQSTWQTQLMMMNTAEQCCWRLWRRAPWWWMDKRFILLL